MKITFPQELHIDAGTLARMCGGTLHGDGTIPLKGLCTDSREADADTAFVAMRGERVDGHNYASAAAQGGCRCILCEHVPTSWDVSAGAAITTGDSELALSALASAYREVLPCKIVGVTGSVGKTTAKEMIAAVLAQKCRLYKSEGNHNSVVGMPLSLLQTPTDTEVAVFEMGMSDVGEIERMSLAARPNIALITHIGTAHMEILGSRARICRAKLEILCGLADNGVLILNGDEPLLANVKGKSYRTLYVSLARDDADFFAHTIRTYEDTTVFDLTYEGHTCRDLRIGVAGRHNVYAAAYAFAVGHLLGLDEEEIRAGLLTFVPDGMRQNRYPYKNITIIEDCYNASPESMKAALEVLALQSRETNGRRIAVLGDMLELGTDAPMLHRAVGAHLVQCGIDRLFALGTGGCDIAEGAMAAGMPHEQIWTNADPNAIPTLGDALLGVLREGDTVLFKASRSRGLERAAAYLKERY